MTVTAGAAPGTALSLVPRGPVTSVVDAGLDRLGVGAYDASVRVVDRRTGRFTMLGWHGHLVNHVAADASSNLLASSSSDHTIGVWDLRSGEREHVLAGHDDDVEAFAFLDEWRGVSASRDHTLIIWDLLTGQPICRLEGHQRDVLSVSVGAGRIFSAGDDRTLRTWSTTGEALGCIGPFGDETDTCDVDAEHGLVALGGDDGVLRLFTLTGEPVSERPTHRSGIKKVAFGSSGHVVTAAYDQRLLLWDATSPEPVAELERPPGVWERSVAWSRDGTRVFAGTFDGAVVTWSVR